MLIDNKIIPWFVGSTRIFSPDDKNKLQIKGKFDCQEFRLNEYNVIGFAPIVIRFEDGLDKEGIRFFLNSKERFVDLTIDTFIAFYYLLTNTDLYNAGANLANYVKTMPYDCGIYNMNDDHDPRFNDYQDNWNAAKKNNGSNNFFDKL